MVANSFVARRFEAVARQVLGWLNQLLQPFRPQYFTTRHFRYLSRTVVVAPWLAGFLSLVLFAAVPQMREVYIRIAESHEVFHGLAGLAALSIFSALLYIWNNQKVTHRIDVIYPDHADIYFDRQVFWVRDFKAVIISALPFSGLAVGELLAADRVERARDQVRNISNSLGAGLDQAEALQESLAGLPLALHLCVGATVVSGALLIWILYRLRWNERVHKWFLGASLGLTLVLVFAPIVSSALTLKGARFAGPLASTCLALCACAVFLRLVIWGIAQLIQIVAAIPSIFLFVIRGVRAPFKQIIAVLAIAVLCLGVKQLFLYLADNKEKSRHVSIFDELKQHTGDSDAKRAALVKTVAEWMHAREIGENDYPVFVVTAEGGGIYAATAVSYFLAKMEERCPGFAEHVFAVSAVSGGSVGATLFDSALAGREPPKIAERANGLTPKCLELKGSGEKPPKGANKKDKHLAGVPDMVERLRRITSDDHLSPMLAYILPDMLHSIGEMVRLPKERKAPCRANRYFEWLGRDQILEMSFIASLSQSASEDAQPVCPPGSNMLESNFRDFWSPNDKMPASLDKKLPALLLNATWVETGYRVAFSPFPLEPLGEGTLYSFDDLAAHARDEAKARREVEFDPAVQNPSLIGAAVVSARFPFIMPPWVSSFHPKNRWTFVDGGYADSSGATTGLELYRELQKQLAEPKDLKDAKNSPIRPGQISLHLIVLSDAYVEPDYNEITGSLLDDFISPFDAMLSVRDLLARRAVTQAYSELGDKLINLQVDQQTFPLPLGWTMSVLSNDLIRLTLGQPDHCKGLSDFRKLEEFRDLKDLKDLPWPIWSVTHNSCSVKRIEDILTLRPKGEASKAAPAPLAAASAVARVESPPPTQLAPMIMQPVQPPAPAPTAPPSPKLIGPWQTQ